MKKRNRNMGSSRLNYISVYLIRGRNEKLIMLAKTKLVQTLVTKTAKKGSKKLGHNCMVAKWLSWKWMEVAGHLIL